MLGKLKTLLYNQVYINIVVGNKKTIIYVEEVFFNGSVEHTEEIFETSAKPKINSFITENMKKSPIHYVSILDNSLSQGATPTCSSADMSQFCDMGVANHICYTKQWGFYTSKLDILELRNKYKTIGLDFIFSPFLILANFFKDKLASDISLYILIGTDAITLSVFQESNLLFAEEIDMQNHNEFQDTLSIGGEPEEELYLDDEDEDEYEDDDAGINLEDINSDDDIESLDDFDSIEDLDTFDEMDEFAEDEVQEIAQTIAPDLGDDENGFGEDYHRFSLIQSSINKFYKDDRFTSDFIQQVYIADSIGISSELKKFLEEEMFLNVFVRKIDLCVELCELAKVEKK